MMKKILFTIKISDEDKKMFDSIKNCSISYVEKANCTLEDLTDKDAVIGNLNVDLLNQAPHLKWVHLETAGADNHAIPLNSNITLTNSTGAYSQSIAEYMIAGILYFYKKFHLYNENQRQNLWKGLGTVSSIMNKTVCVVGYGDIGQTFAKYMKGFNSHIIGVKRVVTNAPYADEIITMNEIKEALPKADIVALVLPKTPETIDVIDEDLLRLCKKDALLINVGRGATMNTDAILNVLNDGYFTGAVLDVVNPEPLPMNHPLWKHPRVFITPHVSGDYNMIETYYSVLDIAKKHIENFCNEEEFENVVDRKTGYKTTVIQ